MPKYFPESPPSPGEIKDRVLFEWVFRELNRVSTEVNVGHLLNLEQVFVAPSKPQDGDILYADGTYFNPGSGKGIYAYIGGSWAKLNLSATDNISFNSASMSGSLTIDLPAAGTLINFEVANILKGAISVDGAGFVTYGTFLGAHWSQLSDGTRPNILKGTIVESIDQMCSWPGEPPELRLPRFKVSANAASTQVYGVFSGWDEEWTATNDALIHSLGASVVRIKSGISVQRGDLIVSNGDGCGKVQSDVSLKSITVAKVTSNARVVVYPDSSYLVPCTLHCG